MSEKVWAIVCGSDRLELETRLTIARLVELRADSVIDGIVLSTWENEVSPVLRNQLSKLGVIIVETEKVRVTSSNEKPIFSSSFMAQIRQIYAGLNMVPDGSFVLKCRTDDTISHVNTIVENINDVINGCLIESKDRNQYNIDMKGRIATFDIGFSYPFVMSDLCFAGYKEDLKKMTALQSFTLTIDRQMFTDSTFFIMPFINRFNFLHQFFQYINTLELSKMLNVIFQRGKLRDLPSLLTRFYGFYFKLVDSCFYSDFSWVKIVDFKLEDLFNGEKDLRKDNWNCSISNSMVVSNVVNGNLTSTKMYQRMLPYIESFDTNSSISCEELEELECWLVNNHVNPHANLIRIPRYNESPNNTLINSVFTRYNKKISELSSSKDFYKDMARHIDCFEDSKLETESALMISSKALNEQSLMDLTYRLYVGIIEPEIIWPLSKRLTKTNYPLCRCPYSTERLYICYCYSKYSSNEHFIQAFTRTIKNQFPEVTSNTVDKVCEDLEKIVINAKDVGEYYYLIKFLLLIPVCKNSNELFKILKKNEREYRHFISSYSKYSLSENVEMLTSLVEVKDGGDSNIMGRIGRMYRDGEGVEKNLDNAIEWMRKAYDISWWWGMELADQLQKGQEKKNHEEAFEIYLRMAEKNKDKAMAYLGRMYRDGKGVEKDLNKAIEWMRKAADKNVGWANELFDVLWTCGRPEDLVEMKAIAEAGVINGNAPSIGRLGRMYRDGKGVEKDNSLAASYFLMAASSGAPWFVCDYVIVKWEDNSSSSDLEAFTALTRYGNIDDVPTMIWLGKAYFHGRGTEKNLAKATEFFRKAYNKGSLWAGFLLFDVLWTMKNDEDAINESIKIAKNLISKGSDEGMIRLARAYREGIGVSKNLDCAIELFNNAINKGNKLAVKELKDTIAENNLIQSDNLIKSIKEGDVDSIISGNYDLSLLNKSMLTIDETGYDLSEFMHGLIDQMRKGNVKKERIRSLVNCINKILSEKDDDYIKQFFVSIPKATGRLREIQMLGNDMLRIFDKVCKKYDVEYSICSGTLLGAIRHNSWIPWDDDIDLLMYMEDIEKLKASLSEDDPIMIQDVNIRADSKQFKPARYYWVKYRGVESSMYIDIFILYHIPDEMNLESIYSQYLEKVYSDMEQFENKSRPQALQTVNSDYVTYFEQLMSSDEKSKRTGIITMGGKIWVFDTSDFKPFIEYEFDGYILKGMHNPHNYLLTNYGNIYSVPHDLGTHKHPLFDSIDANQVRSYTEQYLKSDCSIHPKSPELSYMPHDA